MKLESKYDIGDDVLITAIGMKGKVDSISWDFNAIQYRVVYWNDCRRYSVWMYSWEIE